MAFFRKLWISRCECGSIPSKQIIGVDNERWRICCDACGSRMIAEIRAMEREQARLAMVRAKISLAESYMPVRELTEREADDLLIIGQRQNSIAHANFMGWDVSNVLPERIVEHVADLSKKHLIKIGAYDSEGRSVWDKKRRAMKEADLPYLD